MSKGMKQVEYERGFLDLHNVSLYNKDEDSKFWIKCLVLKTSWDHVPTSLKKKLS